MIGDRGQIGNYLLQSRLGSGAFAQVFKAVNTTNGEIVAVKMIDVYRLTERNPKLKDNLNYEIRILKTVSHPNIVSLYDVIEPPPPQNESYLYMVMECCDGGDFSKYIRKHKKLTEDKAKFFMRQLANGLRFLRMKDIIHRDLKPQNLLLSDNTDSPTLKIADFGFARFIDVQSLSDTFCGSPLYMAPEILNRRNYTVKADLWSVGVILYEMLIGETPFISNSVVDLLHQLDTKRVTIPPHVTISRDCQDLLCSLLQTNENLRISWEDFFSHPWLGFSQNIVQQQQQLNINYNQQMQYQQQNVYKHSSSAPTNPNNYSPQNVYNEQNFMHQQQQQNNNYPVPKGPIPKPQYPSERVLGRSKSVNDNINVGFNPPIQKQGSSEIEKDFIILDDEEYINSIDKISKTAIVIAELGDLRQFEPTESLVLYLKALGLIKAKLTSTNIQNHTFGSSYIYRYTNIIERIKQFYQEYLSKAQNIRSNLIATTIQTNSSISNGGSGISSSGTINDINNNNNNNGSGIFQRQNSGILQTSSTTVNNNASMIKMTKFSANKFIYESALEMGKNGGLEEMYKDYSKSLQLYTDGLILIEYLLSISTDSDDNDVLFKYITLYKERIQKINQPLQPSPLGQYY